jgi:hypothetical protein
VPEIVAVDSPFAVTVPANELAPPFVGCVRFTVTPPLFVMVAVSPFVVSYSAVVFRSAVPFGVMRSSRSGACLRGGARKAQFTANEILVKRE